MTKFEHPILGKFRYDDSMGSWNSVSKKDLDPIGIVSISFETPGGDPPTKEQLDSALKLLTNFPALKNKLAKKLATEMAVAEDFEQKPGKQSDVWNYATPVEIDIPPAPRPIHLGFNVKWDAHTFYIRVSGKKIVGIGFDL